MFGRSSRRRISLRLGCHLAQEAFQQRIDGHHAQVDIAARTNGHSVGIPLFIADNKDVRQFLDRMLANFIGNLLVPQISVNTQTGGFQAGFDLFHVGSLRIRDVQNRNLHRRQP